MHHLINKTIYKYLDLSVLRESSGTTSIAPVTKLAPTVGLSESLLRTPVSMSRAILYGLMTLVSTWLKQLHRICTLWSWVIVAAVCRDICINSPITSIIDCFCKAGWLFLPSNEYCWSRTWQSIQGTQILAATGHLEPCLVVDKERNVHIEVFLQFVAFIPDRCYFILENLADSRNIASMWDLNPTEVESQAALLELLQHIL